MKKANLFYAALIAMSFLSSCATVRGNDSMSSRISRLVDETTRSTRSQEVALAELEKFGQQGVPYLVGHLGDTRPLARHEIILTNSASSSFEGLRHYSPDTVHDAVAAILNQITGKSFEFVYNGATSVEREKNRHDWIDWCKSAYPSEAEECSGNP